jgi:hypothetical protein
MPSSWRRIDGVELDGSVHTDFDRRNVKSQGGELRQCEWVGQRRQGEFVCTAVTFGVFKHSSPNTGLVYRDCIWSLHVQRDPTYYIFKGAVPIYVIVAFAFFQFAMDVDAQLTERLNFLVALMLSSFAIQWTVTDRLPRVPSVWKSKFYGAFVLNRRVLLHAIDATPARWRGDAGSSPLDGARTAASSPRSAPGAVVDFHTGAVCDRPGPAHLCEPAGTFHDGPRVRRHEPGRLQRQARRVRLRRHQANPNVGQGVPGGDARGICGHAPRYFEASPRIHQCINQIVATRPTH